MKVISTTPLGISDIMVLRVQRYVDERGYFTEILRSEDLAKITEAPLLARAHWTQVNESSSKAHVIRGLHFQWAPHQGKLVRVLEGELIDMALDIRADSPTEGKIVAYRLRHDVTADYQDLVWVPPGFAHGFAAVTPSRMEYYCTGSWAPVSERAITVIDPDIDWSLMEEELAGVVGDMIPHAHIAIKDREGLSLKSWQSSPDRAVFMHTLPR